MFSGSCLILKVENEYIAKLSWYSGDSVLKIFKREIIFRSQPAIFDLFPYALNSVQVRTIFGQEKHVKACEPTI